VIADTNLLLRILEGDTGAHGRAARARVEAARTGEPIAVLAATVLEVAFVLESADAGYGWGRDPVAAAVEAIADEPGFSVEHGDALRIAARLIPGRGRPSLAHARAVVRCGPGAAGDRRAPVGPADTAAGIGRRERRFESLEIGQRASGDGDAQLDRVEGSDLASSRLCAALTSVLERPRHPVQEVCRGS
jgi:predicted nucleic-acid-binding protein